MSSLRAAYVGTKYMVFDSPIVIEVSKNCRRLDELLELHDASEWAYITACNPRSEVLEDTENEERHLKLKALVKDYLSFEGEGIGADPGWKPEKSLLILGITSEHAALIGRQMEQNAIVIGSLNRPAELLELFDFE